MPDFYELLNVPSTASFDEIKCSYKQLILQCHPDKLRQLDDPNPGSEAQNSDFNAINAAWNTLKDPIRRKHYDAELLQSKFRAHSNIYATVVLRKCSGSKWKSKKMTTRHRHLQLHLPAKHLNQNQNPRRTKGRRQCGATRTTADAAVSICSMDPQTMMSHPK